MEEDTQTTMEEEHQWEPDNKFTVGHTEHVIILEAIVVPQLMDTNGMQHLEKNWEVKQKVVAIDGVGQSVRSLKIK